jgi:hypothetical protein
LLVGFRAALTAGIADLSKGEWLGLHSHPATEIDYFVEGEGIVVLEARHTGCPPESPSPVRGHTYPPGGWCPRGARRITTTIGRFSIIL